MPRALRFACAVLFARVGCAQAPAQPLPLKYAGPPTVAAITAGDLMTRLYAFADDSMLGRRAGEIGGSRSVNFVAWEMQKAGLKPAGESGYFQSVPTLPATVRAQNVIALLPGSDSVLRNEYVVIGAHLDHIGVAAVSGDHDAIRAANLARSGTGRGAQTVAERARARALTDSLHVAHGARRDSVNNGADDDGSGTVAVLEIAEAFAMADTRPKRSILFVLHNAEEFGMVGSSYFTDHPTVPRDAIVAELNLDMVGRGGADDVTGTTVTGARLHGGPGYVQLVGSRRLSTELGDLVERVNTEEQLGAVFDYSIDANGHPEQIYCRSDHFAYARYGIPVVFFTTGMHADYHQVTDEPQYIDYARLALVSRLVYAVAARVANLDHRVVVDKPSGGPKATCKQ